VSISKRIGREIGQRSEHFAFARDFVGVPPQGEAEVHQDRAPGSIQHDVGGFQVAVDDSVVVNGGEPGGDLAGERDRLPRGEPAHRLDEILERLPVDVLHRDVSDAGDLADLVHAADVQVGNLPRELNFPFEPLHPRSPGGGLGAEELERHRLVQHPVLRLVDLAHASGADVLDDEVAIGEDLSRREPRKAIHADLPLSIPRNRKADSLPRAAAGR
jgi:hypothetical protein